MPIRALIPLVLAAAVSVAAVPSAGADEGAATEPEVTLKLHHFLPPSSNTHANFLAPWAEKVEAASNGRIEIEIYPSMQLGGRPPQLIDQVRDGVVDLVWTLPSYTSGRFPIASVFELPFMVSNAEATSQALSTFAERHLRAEFSSVHPLVFHVHDRGTLHLKDHRVTEIADMEGAKIRAPGRYVGEALKALGASPVFMPVPQVPEAVSRGVIDGAALPYEVADDLKIPDLVDSHTEVHGPRGLYTAVFLLAMNKQAYAELPPDLQDVIDVHSGRPTAKWAGQVWDQAERRARVNAIASGNQFDIIQDESYERWRAATQPVHAQWVEDMNARGLDGRKLLEDAKALVDKYTEGE